MKHVFLYPLISVLTLGVSGVGSYLIQDISHKSSKNDNTETGRTTEEEPPIDTTVEEEPGFSKMINKLMNTKEVKADNASFVLKTTSADPIYLDFTSLDLDIGGAISGDLNSLRFNTTLKVRYKEINEQLSLYYDSDYVYINYGNEALSFDAPKTVAGFLPILSSLNISVPSLPDFGGIDASEILDKAMGILDGVEEKQTESGYEYTLDCNEFLASLDLPISITGAKVVLIADADYNFIGGRTVGDGININDSYTIGLDISSLSVADTSTYEGLDEEGKKGYTNITEQTGNICTTIASLMDKKNFTAYLNLSAKTSDDTVKRQSFEGTIKADLSEIKKDVTKGSYEISLSHKNDGTPANSVYAAYKENNIYVTLNNLIKGKISNKTIQDLLPILSSEIDQDSLPDISESINELIKDTDFDHLLKGDLSVYRNFIADFNATTTGFEMTINAKAFGLGDYELFIALDDTTENLSNGFKLTVKNFRYQNLILSFGFDVHPEENISFRYSDLEFATFKDYCGIIPIFNTVTKLADERKLNTAYSLNLRNLTENSVYSFNGEISADVSTLTLDSAVNNYGDYRLTLNTELNGYPHSLDFAYQNHDLFLTMDTFFKQKMSDSEVGAIYDIINKDKEGTSEAFDGMNTVINSVVNEIKNSYSLKILEDYFTLDKDNVDANVLSLELNLPKFFEGTAMDGKMSALTLLVNTDEERITALSCQGFRINNKYEIDFTLSLEDVFSDFRLSEEEAAKYTEINSASKILNGFYSLPTNLTEFSVNLNGEIQNKAEDGSYQTYMGLYGDAEVNLQDKNSPDVGGTLHLIQGTDSLYNKRTDHKIRYTYSGDKNNGQTLAEYTSNDLKDDGTAETSAGTTKLIMNNADLFSIFDRVTSIQDKQDNLLYPYLKAYFDTAEKVATGLPLMDAIQNKDYTLLLNDYIKEVKVEDRTVTLKLASSILDYNDESGNTDSIIIGFDENYKIRTASIEGFYSDYKIKAEINLSDYSEENREAASIDYVNHKEDFVDVHGFDILLNCLITTTEHHFFDLSGYFKLDMNMGNGFKVDTYYTVYVTIVDSTVQAYLAFQRKENQTINDKGFYGVEFFVENEFVLTERTTNDNGTKKTELFKLTPKEITDNIAYYLLSYIIHIENMTAGETILSEIIKATKSTDNSSSSVTINHNYSSLIDKAVIDETNNQMNLACSIGNLLTIPVVTIQQMTANMKYDGNYELSSFDIHVPLSILGIITGNVDFYATRNSIVNQRTDDFREQEDAIAAEKMKRFETFMAAYNADQEYLNLGDYHFENYEYKYVFPWWKSVYTDNGAKLTRSYSDTTKNFFYGIIA